MHLKKKKKKIWQFKLVETQKTKSIQPMDTFEAHNLQISEIKNEKNKMNKKKI